jgi:hypothetical protein
VSQDREDGAWRTNYFNYFTEVEEQFQRARGTGLFLLSPLDWALIEAWKNSGIPLEAVLRGIDAAFDKWRVRKNKSQMVNSLTYCAQAVMKEAESMANNVPSGAALENADSAPFPEDTVRAHLQKAIDALHQSSGYDEISAALRDMLATLDQHFQDLEQFDQRLSALEDKMAALARTRLSDETLFQMRRELDLQLKPYRGKMTADQLARLEKSFLDRKVYDHFNLPRLSLFYMT